MAFACLICIATRGLRGSDIKNPPKTQEELNKHLEKVHHYLVQREGETMEEAIERFLRKYPEARSCPDCIARGAPWARKVAS